MNPIFQNPKSLAILLRFVLTFFFRSQWLRWCKLTLFFPGRVLLVIKNDTFWQKKDYCNVTSLAYPSHFETKHPSHNVAKNLLKLPTSLKTFYCGFIASPWFTLPKFWPKWTRKGFQPPSAIFVFSN